MASPLTLDRDWVRRSFLVPGGKLNAIDARNRFFSSASLKFVDTTPGANLMINPPPQFTRFADLRARSIRKPKQPTAHHPNLLGEANYTTTLGRYYSESLDDNAQLVHFRMGKTGFNSFLNYLSGYYSYYAGFVAKTGRAPGFFYKMGKAAGMVAAVIAWPYTATLALYKFFKFMMQIPRTKYAYLKPTMPIYWASVQTMVNQVATYMGIVTPTDKGDNGQYGSITPNEGEDVKDFTYLFDSNLKAAMANKLPDIFDEHGNLNVYAMATKGQRLANRHRAALKEVLDGQIEGNLNESLLAVYRGNIKNTGLIYNWTQYLENWMKTDMLGFFSSTKNVGGVEDNESIKANSKEGMWSFLEAEMNDGSAFVTFRVDEAGSIGESFTNSAAESGLKSFLDGAASDIRQKVHTFAGGNLAGGVVGDVVAGISNSITQMIGGVIDGVGMGGLAGILSGGYADIPQHWESSMASMPKASWTIKLGTPYNNPVSKLVNEVVPLCMLLCMALPHSTGVQSYTGPFMLEFYDKGRSQCRYGMVDSISITRGTASTAFSQTRVANGIEVNLSVMDLTSVMHMPLSAGFTHSGKAEGTMLAGILGTLTGSPTVAAGAAATTGAVSTAAGAVEDFGKSIQQMFSDDTAYTDYMAILGSVGLADNVYASRKLRLRFNQQMANWRTHYSVPAIAMAFGDTTPTWLPKLFFRGSSKDLF